MADVGTRGTWGHAVTRGQNSDQTDTLSEVAKLADEGILELLAYLGRRFKETPKAERSHQHAFTRREKNGQSS